jgi:excisionase family DNA binding protein
MAVAPSASAAGALQPSSCEAIARTGVVDPSQLPFLLTADEAAALLRTTRRAIYARAERKLLPGVVYDGRRVLIRRDDLLRSLSERRAASPEGTRR